MNKIRKITRCVSKEGNLLIPVSYQSYYLKNPNPNKKLNPYLELPENGRFWVWVLVKFQIYFVTRSGRFPSSEMQPYRLPSRHLLTILAEGLGLVCYVQVSATIAILLRGAILPH